MSPSAPAPAASTPAPLVLVVEDDPHVARFLRAGLESAGYRALESASGREALRLAADYVPDVVLLDLGLPDLDGLEVTREIRRWSTLPIVVVSARGGERDKVAALDAGADDHLTKPFSLAELLARVRVALRHAARREARAALDVFEAGPLAVDLAGRRVTLAGELVHLTPIEFKLLGVLVRHAGRVVTHAQLLREVWGPGNASETRYLRVYMTHLRRKLEPRGGPRLFVTEAGIGYRLVEG